MSQLVVITNTLGDLGTNCYTVYNTQTRDAVIIDPASNARFLSNLLINQQLHCKGILLTHGHYDHIAAVPELLEMIGHKVPVYAAREEEDVLNDPRKNLSEMLCGRVLTVKADEYLEDGQVLEILDTKMECILVPGHTKGGMSFYFAQEKLLFSGDTLFCRSIGRSDFPTGNEGVLIDSITRKLMTLPDEVTVYPGHNERTTIGNERRMNPFLELS